MARPERKALIVKIEELRGSRVICYVTGDRAPAPAQIGDDALRPLYDHLRQIGKVKKLDLFVYSRGGAIDVPWRFVTALRHASEEWNILIPFRANSAATLIALGADQIVMGPQGELGPIDPSMGLRRVLPGGQVIQDSVSVEDVMAYVRFIQERGGLSDQDALAAGLMKLTDRVDAVSLGNIYRTHRHIRDVARRVLLSRPKPATEQALATIVEMLAEKVYAHGHAIGFQTAHAIGLPVEEAGSELDKLMWSLLEDYEEQMKLRQALDPAVAVATTDHYQEETTIAAVESTAFVHSFTGRIDIQAKRQLPQTLNVSMNLQLAVPADIAQALQPGQQQALQGVLQQLMAAVQPAILQAAQQAAQEALKQQAPIAAIEASFRGGTWVRSD